MKKRVFSIILSASILMSNLALVKADEGNSIVVVSEGCKASVVVGTNEKDASKLFDGVGNLVNNGGDAWKITWGQTGYIQVDLEREYNLCEIKIHRANQGHLKKNMPILASNDEDFAEHKQIGTTTATENKISNVDIWTSASLESTDKYRYVRIQKNSGFDFYPVKIDVYAVKTPLKAESITNSRINADTDIEITFNDYLDSAIDTSKIVVEANGAVTETNITVSDNKLTVSPTDEWKPGGIYKLIIPEGTIVGDDGRVMSGDLEEYFAVSTAELEITEFSAKNGKLSLKAVNKAEDSIDMTLWNVAFDEGFNSVNGEISEEGCILASGEEYVNTDIELTDNFAVYLFSDVQNMKMYLSPFFKAPYKESTYRENEDDLTAEYTDAGIEISGKSEADEVTLFVTVGDTISAESVKAALTAPVKDGAYAAVIELSSDFLSGEYNVWAKDNISDTPIKASNPPFVLSSTDKQSYAEKIADMDEEELKDYFEYDESNEDDKDNSKVLSGIGIIEQRPENKDALYAAIEASELSGEYEQIVEGINKCIALEIVREQGILYAIENHINLLEIDEENEYYKDVCEEGLLEKANEFMKTDYKDTAEFNRKLIESFKLVIFKNAASLTYAQEFAENNNDFFEFKFDGDDYTSLSELKKQEVIKEAMEGTSLEEMQEFFDEKAAKLKAANKKESNKGSSGGGGGGSVKTNVSAHIPLPEVTIAEEKVTEFSDLDESHWAYEAVMTLVEKEIVNGTDGKFMPDNNITREEFVKLLVLAADIKAEGTISFADVPQNAWYYHYVLTAKNSGIVNGVSENMFGTGENITRQDMAVMIYNTLIKCGETFEKSELTFSDSEDIREYAKDAVAKLSKAELIKGRDENNFVPLGNATRAEAATLIFRMLNLIS